ncbi:MAG: hypothetical protein KatS3mg104_2953 [Phycisphaerae bacterium]|nr:MAG: hypothetical protein KatS3mg104_2953 [Phycisphaerae bacterium]
MAGRIGRVYIGEAGASTLTDMGTVRFDSPITETAETTEPDSHGRRAAKYYSVVLPVTTMQSTDSELFDILSNPDRLYRVFVSPSSSAHGDTVTWEEAVDDLDGFVLDNVYATVESTVAGDGSPSGTTITFTKRRRDIFISDGLESVAYFIKDFSNDYLRPQNIGTPYVGNSAPFVRNAPAPYFDPFTLKYKTAAANEPRFGRAPSGDVLPIIDAPADCLVANNSNTSNLLFKAAATGSTTPWNGFTLADYSATVDNTRHGIGRSYSNPSLQLPYCGWAIYKPLGTASTTTAHVFLEVNDGGIFRSFTVQLDLTTGEPVSIPAEDSFLRPLYAGAIPVADGYYFVWASVYIKSVATSADNIRFEVNLTDSAGNGVFSGDGSTAMGRVGAIGISSDRIYPPPAPILTTGSTVSIPGDDIQFPFDATFPSEGITSVFDWEVPIAGNNGVGKIPSPEPGYYYNVGQPKFTAPPGTWTPLGVHVPSDARQFPYAMGSSQFNGIILSSNKKSAVGVYHLSTSLLETFEDGVSTGTDPDPDITAGTSSDSLIRLKVLRHVYIFPRFIGVFKGIYSPNHFNG